MRSPQEEEGTRKRIRQDIARLILRANRARRRALSACYREEDETFDELEAPVPKDELMPQDESHARRGFKVPPRQAWEEDWRGGERRGGAGAGAGVGAGAEGVRGSGSGVGSRRGRRREDTMDYAQVLQRAADVTTYAREVLGEDMAYEQVSVCIPIPAAESPIGMRNEEIGFGTSAPRFLEGRITNNDFFLFGAQKWAQESSYSQLSLSKMKYALLTYDKIRPTQEQERMLRVPTAGTKDASPGIRRAKKRGGAGRSRRHRGFGT
mmetsp:Transcript_5533/g.19451  ORF Transcript_5533/g.19451 Transcript_5533/m.19451 type:complete len:266 (-) Transcript_5533:222-1019(-)